jgi:hypothetical protein
MSFGDSLRGERPVAASGADTSGQFGGGCGRRPAVLLLDLMPDAGHLLREDRTGKLAGCRTWRPDVPPALSVGWSSRSSRASWMLVCQGAVELPHVIDADRVGERAALALDGEIPAAGIGCEDICTAVTAYLAADHDDAGPFLALEHGGVIILDWWPLMASTTSRQDCAYSFSRKAACALSSLAVPGSRSTFYVNCDVRPLVMSGSAEGGRLWRRRDPGPVPEARPRSGMRGWVLLSASVHPAFDHLGLG